MIYPKIELHVHLEGTVRPRTLFEIGRRNGVPLPADSPEGLQELFRFSDLEHFIETWFLVTAALRTADDFRRITVDYAEEAGRHGAVYVEAIFAPTVPARNGIPLQAMFEGYCDGVQEAREQLGIEVRLTPDLNRTSSLEEATRIVRAAIAHRERGVVAVGLGGIESQAPPEAYAEVFRLARDGGLGSVPHAGEVVGPPSVWGALETLRADRIRHGIRSMEDPALVRELAARGTVLDVCPTANVCVGAVRSYDEHPLPEMVAAGIRCSLSTDDPAMFGTDLTSEYAAATGKGLSAREFYEVGVAGALCDPATKAALEAIGEDFDWSAVEGEPPPG
ncbi:MAG TPA: adenosine deaminase [Gaiellaceae bacterium]|nr:adenosine deaminase [Gaiellaceae bacterium]